MCKENLVWVGLKLKEDLNEAGEGCSLFSSKVSENKNLEENKTHASVASVEYKKSVGELISEFLGAFPHDRESTAVEFEMFMRKRDLSEDEARRLPEQMEKDGEVFQVYPDV